ncbi:hypothetical protein T484DRAFT_1743338 [Baffinella frigidus]|nr:hypothetical protein T484DRAFT_1743338 [Cryptophyta sp. CCMP2293]
MPLTVSGPASHTLEAPGPHGSQRRDPPPKTRLATSVKGRLPASLFADSDVCQCPPTRYHLLAPHQSFGGTRLIACKQQGGKPAREQESEELDDNLQHVDSNPELLLREYCGRRGFRRAPPLHPPPRDHPKACQQQRACRPTSVQTRLRPLHLRHPMRPRGRAHARPCRAYPHGAPPRWGQRRARGGEAGERQARDGADGILGRRGEAQRFLHRGPAGLDGFSREWWPPVHHQVGPLFKVHGEEASPA